MEGYLKQGVRLVGDLVFSGTAEERRKQAEVVIIRMHADLYGNGKSGLIGDVREFITDHIATERERKEQHRQNKSRLNLIIALLTLLIGILSLALAAKSATGHAMLFDSKLPPTYTARR